MIRGMGIALTTCTSPRCGVLSTPPVFDCLRAAVLDRKERNIKSIEHSGLLPSTLFYSRLLTDDHDERQRYFDSFLGFARSKDLVFFDPDNGLEIKSVKYGRKGSSRYLFLREVSLTFSAGNSLLVYQHMPPKPRDPFIRDLASNLVRETDSDSVYVFHTKRIAFFLVPQRDEIGRFADSASRVKRKWGDLLETRRYLAQNGAVVSNGLPASGV